MTMTMQILSENCLEQKRNAGWSMCNSIWKLNADIELILELKTMAIGKLRNVMR